MVRAVPKTPPRATALRALRRAFAKNGYLRSAPDRRHSSTHRGYELRFSALSAEERDAIVAHLRALGVEPGRPFAKGPAWRIPIYGKAQVETLAALLRV